MLAKKKWDTKNEHKEIETDCKWNMLRFHITLCISNKNTEFILEK